MLHNERTSVNLPELQSPNNTCNDDGNATARRSATDSALQTLCATAWARHRVRLHAVAVLVVMIASVIAYAQSTSRAITGLIEIANSKQLTIVDTSSRKFTFAIIPSTQLPRAGVQPGKRVRVWYVQADVMIATQVELIP